MTINQATVPRTGFGAPAIDRDVEMRLVLRARRGDSEAFGQLYETTLDRVYRYVFFRVSDDQTAEDLTSKVYLKAWEHLPHYKAGKSPFIAWLYTIAHNAVVDHYRVSKPTTPLSEAVQLPSNEPPPHEQYEEKYARLSDAQSLRKALEQLTDLQRQVLIMKLIDGIDTDKVAARLHKSPGAIRALQMLALEALARIIRKKEVTDTEQEQEEA